MDFFEPTGYGRFDPAAFGMWLNVDKALQHPAYAELGPLMWTTFHFPLDEKHRAYVRAAGSGEDAIFAATCFTVATHERRHFHDLLATPYGSVLARQYLRAAFFYGVLNEEILLRRDKIAVPLDEWCLNARLFKSSFGIDPPSENIVHINGIFKTMLDKLVAFDHGRIDPGRLPEYPTAASILEGLAVMVQLRQIGEEFGLSYGEGFGRSVLQGVGADRYFGALQLIPRMLGQQLPIAAEALLLQASLYGNFQDTDPNRPQYPIDLLASLLAWMSERGVFRLQRPLRQEAYLPYVVEAMDVYFRERQGGSLQDMVRQATVANRGVLEALRKDLASFEQATGRSNPFCKCVLDVFQDFIAVQESFSTRVVNDLAWYTSYEYVRDQFVCPTPPIYIESQLGVPVDSTISELYYIQAEDRMYIKPSTKARVMDDPGSDPLLRHAIENAQTTEELKANAIRDLRSITGVAEGYEDTIIRSEPGTVVIRRAYVLSPRGLSAEERTMRTNLNLSLWQRFYDETCPMRLFLEGPDRGMPEVGVRDTLSAFHAFHIEVFTTSGSMESRAPDPNEVPDLVSNALATLARLKQEKRDGR